MGDKDGTNFLTGYGIMEELNNMPISGYAMGQVIPRTMQKHLAWLGDNPRETEVVSPLSIIRQALRDEAVTLGLAGGNSIPEINLNLSVECEGYQLLHIMQKLDSEYYKQNGRHVLHRYLCLATASIYAAHQVS